MNTELGYVARGFLLMLVVLAGLGVVHFLISIEAPQPVADRVYVSHSSPEISREPAVFNLRGKQLFDDNCRSCHKLGHDHEFFNLPYIEDRISDRSLLRGWIRNSDSVLKAGNPYFNKLYLTWNRTPMSKFPQLSDEDIDEILEYIWRHRR